MFPLTFHIAILDCDTPVPNVYAERGLYSDIFAELLAVAAKGSASLPDLSLEFKKYNCVQGQLPEEKDLSSIDALIITGSAAAAYDQVPWIYALIEFTRNIYHSFPSIKIFGSCFGHQLLCHALFSTPAHCVVERDTAGWELGVHPITLSVPFLSHFGTVESNPSHPSQLRLQFVHADHVVMPLLPAGFHSIGRSEHCVLQGVWKQGRVLTFQGHAEFDRSINAETIKVFGKIIWEEAFMERTLEQVDRDDDAIWAAGVMLRFFLESEAGDELNANENLQTNQDVMARL